LDAPARSEVVARAVSAIVDPLAPPKPEKSALTGLYCLKMLHANDRSDLRDITQEQRDAIGWTWENQTKVEGVVGESVLMQYYSVWDGCATDIRPVPLAEVLSGAWRFYKTHAEWIHASEKLSDHLWRIADRRTRKPTNV
jgi:hypothetical protein